MPEKIISVVQTTRNLDEELKWYCGTLGFNAGKREILEGKWLNELIGMPNAVVDRAKLHLGDEEIELWEFQSSTGLQNNNFQAEVIPVDSKSNDLWFQHICIVVKDIEEAFKKGVKKSELLANEHTA